MPRLRTTSHHQEKTMNKLQHAAATLRTAADAVDELPAQARQFGLFEGEFTGDRLRAKAEHFEALDAALQDG